MSNQKNKSLAVRSNRLPEWRPAQRQLARQLRRMEYIAEVAKAAMDELSDNYTYSEFKMRTSMEITTKLRKDIAAGHIPPEEEEAYRHDTVEFLRRLLEVNQEASRQIRREQQRVPEILDNRNLIDDLISMLSGE
jgi:hypothetical protein